MFQLRQSLKSIALQRRTLITYAKQKQIYIHPMPNNKNIISFSKSPDALAIGEFYSKNPEEEEITTKNLISENKEFLNLLHETIKENIAEDPTYLTECSSFAEEHMPVYDLRKIPNYQRQPEIEDIFGFVRVSKEGDILGETYEKNDIYKLFSVDGPVTLSDHLLEKIRGD